MLVFSRILNYEPAPDKWRTNAKGLPIYLLSWRENRNCLHTYSFSQQLDTIQTLLNRERPRGHFSIILLFTLIPILDKYKYVKCNENTYVHTYVRIY